MNSAEETHTLNIYLDKMNIGAILAGGIGKRMGCTIPKQFLELNGIPIIVYTINKLLSVTEFDKIYIAVHPSWITHLKELINKYVNDSSRIEIISGGEERLDTIQNVIDGVSNDMNSSDDDVIVIHEAVRPFVSTDILKNSIQAARTYGAVVAASPATDTMLWVEKGDLVSSMPDRAKLFHGQAPDSFKVSVLKRALESLTQEERKIITGTSQICMLRGIPIHIIQGDSKNFKITTLSDLQMAEAIAKEELS